MAAEEIKKGSELPDAFSLFRPSWDSFKLNFETFLWQLLLPAALGGLTIIAWLIAIGVESPFGYAVAGVLSFAALCAGVVMTAAIVKTQLASVRKQVVGFRQSLREIQGYVWRLVGLFIVVSIIIVFGLILFIVPGLFAMQRLLLAPYYLVDQNIGIREAIRRSWRAGKQFSEPIWGVVGIIIGINIISWVPFVGWIMSLILTIMYLNAPTLRYIQVTKKREHLAPVKA